MVVKKRNAFTLIELVIVIVILGILAATAIPKFVDLSDKAKEQSCSAHRGVVASTCALYKASEAAAGRTPAFPSDYDDASLYGDGITPSCPSSGTWTYSTVTGKVTCNTHP